MTATARTAPARSPPRSTSRRPGATFPFGAHVAVVEVDLETGTGPPRQHVAVDDCGRILNPLLVRGQQHGGIAQGAAQALWEQFVYDEDGNPITSTLAEYAMPSAAELPFFETVNTETPTPLNPLGAKGIGESGHDRLDARGAERRDRRGQPPRRAPHRDALHAGAGLAGHRPAGGAATTVGWREPPAFFDSLPGRGERPRPPPPPMSTSEAARRAGLR